MSSSLSDSESNSFTTNDKLLEHGGKKLKEGMPYKSNKNADDFQPWHKMLQSANRTSKKDFLQKILQRSGTKIKEFVIKRSLSTSSRKNDNEFSSDSEDITVDIRKHKRKTKKRKEIKEAARNCQTKRQNNLDDKHEKAEMKSSSESEVGTVSFSVDRSLNPIRRRKQLKKSREIQKESNSDSSEIVNILECKNHSQSPVNSVVLLSKSNKRKKDSKHLHESAESDPQCVASFESKQTKQKNVQDVSAAEQNLHLNDEDCGELTVRKKKIKQKKKLNDYSNSDNLNEIKHEEKRTSNNKPANTNQLVLSTDSELTYTDLKQASCQSTESNSASLKLLNAFKEENELNEVLTKPELSLSNLTKDDEIFLVQIPKNIHPQLLVDSSVTLNDKSKFCIEGKTYIWDASNDSTFPFVVLGHVNVNNYGIRNLECKKMVVREQFKSIHNSFKLQPVKETVSLPVNLKQRHPLFGTNYDEKICLNESILEKLCYALKRKEKYCGIKNIRTKTKLEPNINNLDVFKFLNDPKISKKRKIKKHEVFEEVQVTNGNLDHVKKRERSKSFCSSLDNEGYKVNRNTMDNESDTNPSHNIVNLNDKVLKESIDDDIVIKKNKKKRHLEDEKPEDFLDYIESLINGKNSLKPSDHKKKRKKSF